MAWEIVKFDEEKATKAVINSARIEGMSFARAKKAMRDYKNGKTKKLESLAKLMKK